MKNTQRRDGEVAVVSPHAFTDVNPPGGLREDAQLLEPAPRKTLQQIFFVALILHLLAIGFILVTVDDINNISRDSYWYNSAAVKKADAYARGEIDWSKWIDEAWWEIIGVVYFVFGPHLIFVCLLNALITSGAAVLVYQITRAAFGHHAVAAAAGYIYAAFPSIVYYTSLPLKEALAGFGILAIVYGVILIIGTGRFRGWLWTLGGLAIVAGLRVYLVPIFVFCIALSILTPRLNKGMAGVFQFLVVAVLLGAGAYGVIKISGIRIDMESEMFRYFDVENVNAARKSLNHGHTQLFSDDADAAYNGDPLDDAWRFIKGVLFLIFTINPAEANKARQLAAVPEAAFFLYCIPFIYYGVVQGWRNRPNQILPIVLFGMVIVLVYGSAATNAGAMYRWRIQALPFLFMIVAYGAALRRKGLLFDFIVRLGYQPYPGFVHQAFPTAPSARLAPSRVANSH